MSDGIVKHKQPDLVAENQRLQGELVQLTADIAEAERAKQEYMQNVAHQLAAPINAIKMNIEAIKNPRIPLDRTKVLLRSVYAQGTILAHLIKNFSLMSHLDADHALNSFREEPEEFDLFLLCVNFSNDFQPAGTYKEQTIHVSEDEFRTRPQIWAIKNLFAQVIYNLLENATKYGDEGSHISIGMRVDSKYISTTVTSFGLPISPTEAVRIFERGIRGGSAKKLHPAGTGFGLFIAQRIMKIHHGDIQLEIEGRKTTFVVRCPKNLKGLL